jgi:branched-chain amino acid transport system substrate-binding protein
MFSMKKAVAVLLICLSICFISLSCAKKVSNTIRIGIAGAQSGDLASYGLSTVKAARIVVDAVNEKGGIRGKKIELIVEDDECLPEKAAVVASKLVGDKVVAVIGHICIGATKSALSIYGAANIITISPSAKSPDLTQSGLFPNFFRTIASDDMQARIDVDFAVSTLKCKRIAILHDKGDYGKDFADYVKGFLEKKEAVEVVLFDGITTGQLDYSPVIDKIEKEKADCVIYGGYHPEASKLILQIKKRKLDIAFITDDVVKDDAFIKATGTNAEGVYVSGVIDTSGNPLAQKAIEEYADRFQEAPGQYYLNAYSAILLLLNAIENAGSLKYEDLVKVLRADVVETPLGNLSFDVRGDALGVGFTMFQIRDGVFVEVQ